MNHVKLTEYCVCAGVVGVLLGIKFLPSNLLLLATVPYLFLLIPTIVKRCKQCGLRRKRKAEKYRIKASAKLDQ